MFLKIKVLSSFLRVKKIELEYITRARFNSAAVDGKV